MSVKKSGPRQRIVGETALFTLAITNTGEVPLTNLTIVDEYPPTLRATPTTQGYQRVAGGDNRERFRWDLPRLEVGATERFDVQCQCVGQSEEACSGVQVSADTGTQAGTISGADRACVLILPSRDVVPGGAGPPPGGGASVVPPGPESLQLGISSYSNPVRVGQRATYEIVIQNGPRDDQQVQLRVLFPAELRAMPAFRPISPATNCGSTSLTRFARMNGSYF